MKSKEGKELLKKILKRDLKNKLDENPEHYTPVLLGASGIAKTEILKQAAKEVGYDEVIIIELNTISPLDIKGLPYPDVEKKVAEFFKPEFFREDDGRKYLYFFDDFNNAPPMTQSVVYSIARDRVMGSHKLPKFTTVVLAGNRAKDKGATFSMPEPLANRCVFISFEPNARDFIDYHNGDLHTTVAAFLEYSPRYIHKDLIEGYKVGEVPAFPSYRTFKQLSDFLKENDLENEKLNPIEINAFIGSEVGMVFHEFACLQHKLPNLDDLLFERSEDQYATDIQIQYFIVVSLFLRLEHYIKTKEYYDKISNQTIKLSEASLKKLFVNYVKYVLRFSDQNELKVLGATYIMRSENRLTYYYNWLGQDHPIFLEIERIMGTTK